MPVNRPIGRALIVASPSTRGQTLATLQRHGYTCAEADDPYAAMGELCRRPLVYRAIIFGLVGVYREELAIIATIKRRFPHVEIWLTQTDGRQGLLAEALRLGADGLMDDDGPHRIAVGAPVSMPTLEEPVAPERPVIEMHAPAIDLDQPHAAEAVLTAEELRALLQEQPARTEGE